MSNGKIKAKKNGKAVITVTTKDGKKKAKCTVYVGSRVKGVKLSSAKLSLKVGATKTLKPKFTPKTPANKSVTWKSSNTKAVTVSNGKLTAKAAGSAIITVTTKDGKKRATCEVTVTA